MKEILKDLWHEFRTDYTLPQQLYIIAALMWIGYLYTVWTVLSTPLLLPFELWHDYVAKKHGLSTILYYPHYADLTSYRIYQFIFDTTYDLVCLLTLSHLVQWLFVSLRILPEEYYDQ